MSIVLKSGSLNLLEPSGPVREPDSSLSIATGYGSDGPRIESGWGARFSAPFQTGLGAHPASCTMGTGSSPGVKSGRGVALTSHPLLVPWSRKSTATPLLPLWAVRPVQSLGACTRVHFTFFTRVFVEELRKTTQNVRVAGMSTEIRNTNI